MYYNKIRRTEKAFNCKPHHLEYLLNDNEYIFQDNSPINRSMANSSISLIVTSVCLDSASSPVNIALKYGLQALRMTLCAKIFLAPTFRTTSQSSRCRRRRLSSVRVFFGCFSEECDNRAGDGGRSPPVISPILHGPLKCWAS